MLAHLYANLDEPAKDLDLVLGDELGEGDEEADLEGLQSVVVHLEQEQRRVAEHNGLDHVDSHGDDV